MAKTDIHFIIHSRHCLQTQTHSNALYTDFTSQCVHYHHEIRKFDTTERRFRRKRTAANKRNWVEKLKAMRVLYEDKNNNYWRTQISASKGDSKRLWRTLDGFLGRVESDDTGVLTADDFATFFNDKVESVGLR